MRIALRLIAPLALALTGSASPPAKPAPKPTAASIVDGAPASAWKDIPPQDLLVMKLAGDKSVIIQLNDRFSPVHVANIRAIARAGWWDGKAVYRVQDNWVAQWGDVTEKLPLPAAVRETKEDYWIPARAAGAITRLPSPDSYAKVTGFIDGWPVASDGKATWLTHCYASVGVARDLHPNAGSGAELYAVIGQPPRALDRNIVVAGRVIEGIATLAALPRGTGNMGFYGAEQAPLAILSARIMSDLPAADQVRFKMLDTASPSFAQLMKLAGHRDDDFYRTPAAGVDVCSVRPPIRRKD
ncbi:MAG: peptidylprolyl isomerase [Sphingobium sp.]